MPQPQIVTEHFHLDLRKFFKMCMKQHGEYYRSIVAKFSDKEIEEAMKVGSLIEHRLTPEDGIPYEVIAMLLWCVDKDKCRDKAVPKDRIPFNDSLLREYLNYDVMYPKIDRLLYVLQTLMFESTFNAEPTEKEGKYFVPIIPYVMSANKNNHYFSEKFDIKIVFNAACSDYFYEAIEKLGYGYKMTSDDIFETFKGI